MHHQILFLIVIFCVCCAQGVSQAVPQIIFDTDMGPDYDDVGALAVLHALAAEGECDILATVSSNGHSTTAPTIEVKIGRASCRARVEDVVCGGLGHR